MKLQGKVINPRNAYVSFAREARGDELFVLAAGDYGVVEYVVTAKGLEKRRDISGVGPVAIAERDPFGAIAVVGSGSRPDLNQRRVSVFSADEAGKCIASRQFKTPILSLAFSCKGHLAVCLADRIFWFKYAEKGESVKQVPTCQNPDGVFAISDDGHLLAYPVGPNVICVRHGNEELGRVTTDSPFCRLRFNPKGAGQDLLAAVSEGGKTVWVWSLQRNEQKMTLKYEFTRSRASQCRVEGLDFNSLSTLLSLSTDSGTVHVFELSDANQQSKGGYFGSMTSWIPSVVAPSVTSKFKVRVKPRSHALACLMVGEMLMPSEVDGGEDGGQPRRSVFVLTSTGNLQEYSLPEATAGGSSVLETDLPLRSMRVFV